QPHDPRPHHNQIHRFCVRDISLQRHIPYTERGVLGSSFVIELVVLDVAGTTVDEHGDVYLALRDAVAAEGADVSDALVRQWMGTDKREAIAALVAAGGGQGP